MKCEYCTKETCHLRQLMPESRMLCPDCWIDRGALYYYLSSGRLMLRNKPQSEFLIEIDTNLGDWL